jgi:hypothetical protein
MMNLAGSKENCPLMPKIEGFGGIQSSARISLFGQNRCRMAKPKISSKFTIVKGI